MPVFKAEELTEVATGLVSAMGAGPEAARAVAEHLVGANLAGHDSHGMIRVPQYHEHAKTGVLAARAAPCVERESPTTARIDGNWTWGQVTAGMALELAADKARRQGVAVVTARRCYHVGRVGVYPLLAARRGLVAKIWCNGHGAARVAPWGGVEPRLATNPIAIALPTRGEPILVDVTTSVVAEGKVRLLRNQGKPAPEGWILDREGNPTTNPADLYAGGTLLPLGGAVGHKGFGLGLVVDILGGVLSGAGSGLMTGAEVGNGLWIEVVDPEAFVSREEYLARLDTYLEYLRSSRLRPGFAEVLLPGEPETRTEARRRAAGIEIDEETWRQVQQVARELGVPLA